MIKMLFSFLCSFMRKKAEIYNKNATPYLTCKISNAYKEMK